MSDDGERIVQCSATTGAGTRCRKRALPGSSRCAHHSFAVPGRPTKLTPELTARILDGVLGGNYLEPSAQLAGVSKATLYRWLRRAEDLEARALELVDDDDPNVDVYTYTDPAEWVYLDFRHALKSAEAYAETVLLERVRGGGFGWQAFMTILERRHPTRWGRRQALDHTIVNELEKRASVDLVAPDEPERRAGVAAILASAGALDEDETADG